jgi:hypothetical protein
MASIILVTIDLLACGFFAYVLLKWMRETNRKPSSSGSNETHLSSLNPTEATSRRHQDKKAGRILTIRHTPDKDTSLPQKEISAQKRSTPHRTHTISSLRPK